jgi:hypothetical protein
MSFVGGRTEVLPGGQGKIPMPCKIDRRLIPPKMTDTGIMTKTIIDLSTLFISFSFYPTKLTTLLRRKNI